MNAKLSPAVEGNPRITVQRLIGFARYHGVREGVPRADLEDCEVTFVEQMLLWRSPSLAGARGHQDAWLHRCARNHARNYRRGILRRELRCVSLSTLQDHTARQQELMDHQSPERQLMQSHLRSSIDTAVKQLVPEVRSMLVSHYILGHTAAEIACLSGRSRHAVEQALYRARITVRSQLSRSGVAGQDV